MDVFNNIGTAFVDSWKIMRYDGKLLYKSLANMRRVKRFGKQSQPFTPMDQLVMRAEEIPDKPFIRFEDEIWTYKNIEETSNQIGRVLHDKGIQKGDAVAMFMTSQPLFAAVWFGVAKNGATSAFINHNLRKSSLLHCLSISKSKIIIISDDDCLIDAIEEVWAELQMEEIEVYMIGKSDHAFVDKLKPMSQLMESESTAKTPVEWRKEVTLLDNFCLIYTSGTTGLPKAANVRYTRTWLMSYLPVYFGITSKDTLYAPLPSYHAIGAIVGILGILNLGATTVMKKKFSASAYWDDCRKYNATAVVYIGEIAHYVCNQPVKSNDKHHAVRLAIGNGMRPNVWKQFQERFGVKRIGEYYGSTEGLQGFLNLDFEFGCVGKLSPLLNKLFKIVFAKYDYETNDIVRDDRGRVVQARRGEPGLMLNKVGSARLGTKYDGYYGQKKLTEKKLIHDVINKGDCYFNTGDIMLWNKHYHLKFVDRVGDTFRWKGENVSTNEVSNVVASVEGIEHANVYGVEIPGKEGRCGMMALTLDDKKLDFSDLYQTLCKNLPSYAHPLFIRVVPELALTGTWKLKKNDLVSQGYNLDKVGDDKLYFLHPKDKTYIPLTNEIIDEIEKEQIKV